MMLYDVFAHITLNMTYAPINTQNYQPLLYWDVDEVAEFITYLGENGRWRRKYPKIIHKKNIDGEYLSSCDKYDLMKLGFERKDAKKVLYAFWQVCGSQDSYSHHKPRKSSSPTRSDYTESFYSIRSLSDL